jgi:hypothetical protein
VITAAIVSFVVLLVAWLVAPGEARETVDVELSEPARAVARAA